jgi:hypothetical protein
VPLTASVDLTVRRSGDGRWLIENRLGSSDQGRAASSSPVPHTPTGAAPPEPKLEPEEVTILRSWAEAIAEVLASAPERLHRTLAQMDGDGKWRAKLGIEEWSSTHTEAVEAMRRLLITDAAADVGRTHDRALAVVRADRPDASASETLARAVPQLALEKRCIRHLKPGFRLADAPH